MRISLLPAILLAGTTPVASTSPFCQVITGLVSKYSASATASSYCSSFLSVSTRSVTVTSQSTSTAQTTVTSTTGTTTITVINTNTVSETAAPATTTITAIATYQITPTVTATTFAPNFGCYTSTAAARLVKRATSTKAAKPQCFNSISASSLLSSACSCLSLATPTTTVTALQSSATTSTVVINVAATTSITQTVTTTATVPAVLPPVSETVSVTTTVTVAAVTAYPSHFRASTNTGGFLQIKVDPAATFHLGFASTPASLSRLGVFSLRTDCVLQETEYGYLAHSFVIQSMGMEITTTQVEFDNAKSVQSRNFRKIYCRIEATSLELLCGFAVDAVYRVAETGGNPDLLVVDGQPKTTNFVVTVTPTLE
ncbi:hypothetical protein B0A48_04098 [Cryoendolithus antarcticus]|uniref:Uncharacterized protein n=1 Tax=Cryoendolithus antarcticus TaxID=1507870 RepID=A0A1V8THQ9_9PEZI|nr:hypothetical protein B0A48_04098 [Cryoendolithus antarcticus]